MEKRVTYRYRRYYPTALLLGLINLIIAIVELLIILRIVLKLFGAASTASFVSWIYVTSGTLISPFINAFPSPVFEGRYVLEFSAVFALIIYAIIGYLITELIDYVDYSSVNRRD